MLDYICRHEEGEQNLSVCLRCRNLGGRATSGLMRWCGGHMRAARRGGIAAGARHVRKRGGT